MRQIPFTPYTNADPKPFDVVVIRTDGSDDTVAVIDSRLGSAGRFRLDRMLPDGTNNAQRTYPQIGLSYIVGKYAGPPTAVTPGDKVLVHTKGHTDVVATVQSRDGGTVATVEELPDGTRGAFIGPRDYSPEDSWVSCIVEGKATEGPMLMWATPEALALRDRIKPGDRVRVHTKGHPDKVVTANPVLGESRCCVRVTSELPDGTMWAYVGFNPDWPDASWISATVEEGVSQEPMLKCGSPEAVALAASLKPGDTVLIRTYGYPDVLTKVSHSPIPTLKDNACSVVVVDTRLPDGTRQAYIGCHASYPRSPWVVARIDTPAAQTVFPCGSVPVPEAPAHQPTAMDHVRAALAANAALRPHCGNAKPNDFVYHIPSAAVVVFDHSMNPNDCVVIKDTP